MTYWLAVIPVAGSLVAIWQFAIHVRTQRLATFGTRLTLGPRYAATRIPRGKADIKRDVHVSFRPRFSTELYDVTAFATGCEIVGELPPTMPKMTCVSEPIEFVARVRYSDEADARVGVTWEVMGYRQTRAGGMCSNLSDDPDQPIWNWRWRRTRYRWWPRSRANRGYRGRWKPSPTLGPHRRQVIPDAPRLRMGQAPGMDEPPPGWQDGFRTTDPSQSGPGPATSPSE